MVNLKEIVEAYEIERVSETYHNSIEITDLQDELETKSHVLVIKIKLLLKN